ncbi:MAG: hypothetical protein QNJ31_07315 [Candidatus Caenarcaniphilales bacterium]|nr:hypothetical protein [Candidatus Caenarcaniphilales bacterium]
MTAGGAPQPQQPQAPGGPQIAPVLQNRPVQIVVGVLLLVIIVGTIIFFVNNAGKDLGSFKSLVKGIDQGRGLEIAAQLKSKGIETEIVPADVSGVEVQVREKQYDDAVLELARSDLLLTDDFKLFDKTDWAASDYEKRVKYMRAVGGEVSRLISRMDGIRWAKAHVTIPPEKLFTSRYIKDKTSASITIELEPGRTLTNNQVSSIQSLVSGYVPEIDPSRISIIDTKGRVYSSAYSGDDSEMTDWSSKSVYLNSDIEKRVQEYLDSMVGVGKSKVAVSTRIVNQKTVKNITNFRPGAIGTQEYSEEALGNAAIGRPYTGPVQNNGAPPPREVQGYHPSHGSELVDPRLNKDTLHWADGAVKDQEENALNEMPLDEKFESFPGQNTDGSMSHPQASKQNSSYDNANGLYAIKNVNQASNMSPQHNRGEATRFVCAEDDEVCKRNYRRHNFAIQSYPSYEQTKIETPPGRIQKIKVSAVIEKGSLPVSINKLKSGIAAAADPSMSPADVEIILRPIKQKNVDKKEKKNQLIMFNDDGLPKFQWWWIPVILVLVIIVFSIFRAIGSLLVGKPKTFTDRPPFPPQDAPPQTQQPSPFDRLNVDRSKQAFPQVDPQINQRPPAQEQAFNIPTAPVPPRPVQEEEELNIPSTQDYDTEESLNFDENLTRKVENTEKAPEELPFDLNDEFGEEQAQETPKQSNIPTVKPKERPKPKVFIEDEN